MLTNDGKTIVGELKGVDGVTNLILADSVEKVYSNEADKAVQTIPLGLYIVRGDNIAIVGEIEQTEEKQQQQQQQEQQVEKQEGKGEETAQ